MNNNKDYYRTLGVLEDAEDIVIKAAYRALAQKYHPDKFQGNAKVAEERMKEINEAYAVLSDAASRKKYDETRVKSEYEDETSEDTDDLLHTLDKDWAEATEYFPDLVEIASSLSIYSKQLEYTFKVLVIDGKDFNHRVELAKRIKQNYLEKYFGTNKKIHEFAELLFKKQRRDILAKLNRAVTLLGSNVDPKIIIEKLQIELYPMPKSENSKHMDKDNIDSARFYASKLLDIERFPEHLQVYYALEFLKTIGIRVHQSGIFISKFDVYMDGEEFTYGNIELIEFSISKAKEYMGF